MFPKLPVLQPHLVGLAKHRWPDPTPRIPRSIMAEVEANSLSRSKMPHDAAAAGVGSHRDALALHQCSFPGFDLCTVVMLGKYP